MPVRNGHVYIFKNGKSVSLADDRRSGPLGRGLYAQDVPDRNQAGDVCAESIKEETVGQILYYAKMRDQVLAYCYDHPIQFSHGTTYEP